MTNLNKLIKLAECGMEQVISIEKGNNWRAMLKLVIATGNIGKVKEIEEKLKEYPLIIKSCHYRMFKKLSGNIGNC